VELGLRSATFRVMQSRIESDSVVRHTLVALLAAQIPLCGFDIEEKVNLFEQTCLANKMTKL
jgi:hypothetical protein